MGRPDEGWGGLPPRMTRAAGHCPEGPVQSTNAGQLRAQRVGSPRGRHQEQRPFPGGPSSGAAAPGHGGAGGCLAGSPGVQSVGGETCHQKRGQTRERFPPARGRSPSLLPRHSCAHCGDKRGSDPGDDSGTPTEHGTLGVGLTRDGSPGGWGGSPSASSAGALRSEVQEGDPVQLPH